MHLTGIHHLTAITARAADNFAFYTRVLGLRLVKKTVNQDDVSAYHLFYADGVAAPGTDLTFFDWPAPPEQRGTNSITRTGLRVAGPGGDRLVARAPGAAGRRRTPRRSSGTGASPSISPTARASASASSTMAGRGRRIPGRGARCRRRTRSAGSARSASRWRSRSAPRRC